MEDLKDLLIVDLSLKIQWQCSASQCQCSAMHCSFYFSLSSCIFLRFMLFVINCVLKIINFIFRL